jgi:hypothetical protein
MKRAIFISTSALMILLNSCKKEESATIEPTLEKTTEILVSAAPVGNYTFFSFSEGKEIPASDSNSTKWDFGLRDLTFIINNEASGPGQAYVKIINQPYSDVTNAAVNDWRYDTTTSKKAITSFREWATYSRQVLSPLPGKTFLFVTAMGKFAKMEMIKADALNSNGEVIPPGTSGVFPSKFKYSFRYFSQKNGTPNFQ